MRQISWKSSHTPKGGECQHLWRCQSNLLTLSKYCRSSDRTFTMRHKPLQSLTKVWKHYFFFCTKVSYAHCSLFEYISKCPFLQALPHPLRSVLGYKKLFLEGGKVGDDWHKVKPGICGHYLEKRGQSNLSLGQLLTLKIRWACFIDEEKPAVRLPDQIF